MKNEKTFLNLGIITLVLFLGVCYAVVSSVYLNIGGVASVNDTDLNVEITNAVAITSINGKNVDFQHDLSDKNLTSNFILKDMELGEKIDVTYTVTNNEEYVDAELSLIDGVALSNSNLDYFNVDYQITDNLTDLKNNDKTMEVVVTVELIKTPVTEVNSSTTVELTLKAIPKGSSGGTGDVVADSIYYNQPYNAVFETETYASGISSNVIVPETYNLNSQTNVRTLVSKTYNLNSQVYMRKLANTTNEHIKSFVVYDDFSVEIFLDGVLEESYPTSSVVIEGQTLIVEQEFEAQFSDDFKTITINGEVYALNSSNSSLKIGGDHMYSGYEKDIDDSMMQFGVVFKSNSHLDAYFNGNLFGESSTEYYTVGNKIYTKNVGEEASLYGYVSLDGTQIISKGRCIFQYQGKDKLYYGRAYSGFGSYDEDEAIDRVSVIPYRDGSFDLIVDWHFVDTAPAGSITIDGDIVKINYASDSLEFAIADDGLVLTSMETFDNVEYTIGFILEDIRFRENILNKNYKLFFDEEYDDIVFEGDGSSFTLDDSSYPYIINDKAIILGYGIFQLFYYDEETGIYSTIVKNISTGETSNVTLTPIE